MSIVIILLISLADGSIDARLSPLLASLKADQNQPSAWREAGKLCLDRGECAEAYRLFRLGAAACPDDESLQHHRRVYALFHGEDEAAGTGSRRNRVVRKDAFLSLDVPQEAAPPELASKEGLRLGES